MSGLVVGFLLVTVLVGWVLHPVFAGRGASVAPDATDAGAALQAMDPGQGPGVESEIAGLRARLREGRACSRCGALILDADRFCGGCGVPRDFSNGSPANPD
jgi:hypothetical protein